MPQCSNLYFDIMQMRFPPVFSVWTGMILLLYKNNEFELQCLHICTETNLLHFIVLLELTQTVTHHVNKQ